MTTVLADAYFHTLDPFVVQFTPTIGLRWYGLSYAVGFLMAWWMVRWVSRRGWSPIPPDAAGDLMFAVILGVLVGGRLGYAIFYERHLLTGFSNHFPYWDLLAITNGGMASHGGIIGVIGAVWWFGWKRRISSLHILDVGSLACTPGLFFGRIANFINGELHGRVVSDQVNPPWWSMKFPQEMHEWSVNRLESLREAVELVNISSQDWIGALQTVAADPAQRPQKAIEFIHSGIGKLIAAVQNHDSTVIETIRPLLTAYYPSQLIQALTDGPILLGTLVLIWRRPRKPGVVGSWFLIVYGTLRILSEFFRQPDQGVALTLGLSRGQLLSLLMAAIGLVCLWVSSRRSVPKLGGLLIPSRRQEDSAV